MRWADDTDEAFPPRHPREPGGLRQDILDEIADHLECAAEREAECGGENDTEDAAWRRVLERFGNPDAIARKLWWDEMRETVMREWIQTGVVVVVAIVVVVFMTLVMRQMNTANQAVLEALKSNATAVNPLVTLKVKVTRGTEDGPPAEGVSVSVSGAAFGEYQANFGGTTDALGKAEFGPVQPGQYQFTLMDRVSTLSSSTTAVPVFAGKDPKEIAFVAPDVVPREVNLELGAPLTFGKSRALHAIIETEWRGGGVRWGGRAYAVLDDSGGFSVDPDPGDQKSVDLVDTSDWTMLEQERHPLKIAGDIVSANVTRIQLGARGKAEFRDQETVPFSNIARASDGNAYRLALSPKFIEQHAELRAKDYARSRGIALDEKLWRKVRETFPELTVDSAVRVAGGRWGLSVEGALVSPPANFSVTSEASLYNTRIADLVSPPREVFGDMTASFVAFLEGPPEELVSSGVGGRLILALNVQRLNGEEFDQSLQVWPVLNDVIDPVWPTYEDTVTSGLKPILGASPLASISVTDLVLQVGNYEAVSNWILFDLSENLQAADSNVRGREFLLQWARNELEFESQLHFVSPEARELELENRRPMWLVLKPMDGVEEVAAAQ
jgi:hypothetical protein